MQILTKSRGELSAVITRITCVCEAGGTGREVKEMRSYPCCPVNCECS